MNEKVDFLVVGTGIAGLSAAIQLQKRGKVLMLSKNSVEDCNTYKAAGGIACVSSESDSFEKHTNDTLIAGDGLCKRDVVESIVKSAPARIKDLIDLGIKFDKSADGKLDLGQEGGHTERRVLHVKDLTGEAILKVLYKKAKSLPNIEIKENHMVVNLYSKDKRCYGAYVLDKKKNYVYSISAKATILATGGCGKVYLYTSNLDSASGDGVAIAYRAGAKIANMEFVQFHPTCLYHPFAKNALISEALRGEGAILKDKRGNRFMEKYHPLKELAPRDIVSQAIDDVLKKTGDDYVLLDISFKDADYLRKRFPGINEVCLKYGIDFTKEPIPIVPAAHYFCGGILADINGMTNISNLYAIGECACTGLQGANRLACNSLLEGLVCGYNCGSFASLSKIEKIPDWESGNASDPNEAVVITQNWDEIRHVMKNYVNIVRTNKWLQRAESRLKFIEKEINQYYWDFKITSDLIELRNLCTVAQLIVKSAMSRKESRGTHYNLDYPNKLEEAKDTVISI